MASFSKSDLEFLLKQIQIAEAHASGQLLADLLPNSFVPFGLRTVDGTFNHLVTGQSQFGAADTVFPRMTTPVFRTVTFDPDGTSFDPNGAANAPPSPPRIYKRLALYSIPRRARSPT